jgi:hypothetical protein
MKSKRHQSGRIELGRISIATLGSTFGTIEQVGLYQPKAGISDE